MDIPRNLHIAFQQLNLHKLRILYMLNIFQWTPLPEEEFPHLSNHNNQLITFFKKQTAISIRFSSSYTNGTEQKDTPINIFKITSSPNPDTSMRGRLDGKHGEHNNLSFRPLYSVTPKKLNFSDDFTSLTSSVGKWHNQVTINLQTGDVQLVLSDDRNIRFTKIRNLIANFAKKHKRLPCYNDLRAIQNHKTKYKALPKSKNDPTQPSLFNSRNLSGAVAAGYLRKIKHTQIEIRPDNFPEGHGFPKLATHRTLYMPLFPDLGQEPHDTSQNYERFINYEGLNKSGEYFGDKPVKTRKRKEKIDFTEL